jgi:hypothetical protein
MGVASGIMVAAVTAKLLASDINIIINIGISSLILGAGLWAGWYALRLLRAMPSAVVEPSVEFAAQH